MLQLDTGLGTHFTGLGDVPHTARAAEESGFGALWVPETKHDPFLPVALAAEHTQRIRLGTAVAIAFPRSPMVLAHIGWDLAQFSGGRFILGLGTQVKGHNERRFSVPWVPPGPRLRDMVLAIRAIWDCWQHGTRLDFRSRHYTHTLMTPFFNPGPIEHPDIPIFLGGVNPYMCRIAGEVADGLLMHSLNSVTYIRTVVLPAVLEGLQKSGRPRSAFTLRGTVFPVLGDTEEELDRALRYANVSLFMRQPGRTKPSWRSTGGGTSPTACTPWQGVGHGRPWGGKSRMTCSTPSASAVRQPCLGRNCASVLMGWWIACS